MQLIGRLLSIQCNIEGLGQAGKGCSPMGVATLLLVTKSEGLPKLVGRCAPATALCAV
jgi:hypothetical protein